MILVERCTRCGKVVTFEGNDLEEPPIGAKFVCDECFQKISASEKATLKVINTPPEKVQ